MSCNSSSSGGGSGSSSDNASGNTSGSSSVIQHFRENFELSGFGSPAEALVQTVKELVDNAVDACRSRSSQQEAPMVRVVLRRLDTNGANGNVQQGLKGGEQEDEGLLELQVADNGCGLSDVTKSLVLFSSTKSKSGQGAGKTQQSSSTAGKYGLGLTLSLLYSQKHFGGFLKTTTATLDSPEWTLTKSEIDLQTGLPRTFYRKSGLKPEDWSNGCGTDMRLLVAGDEDSLTFAEPRLRALFARMHLLPDRAAGVLFACEGCLGNMTISVPRGGREASPHLLEDNDDLVRAFAKGFAALKRANDGVGILEANSDGDRLPPSAGGSSTSAGVVGVDQEFTSDLRQLDERQRQQQKQRQKQQQSGDAGLSQSQRTGASQRNRPQGAAATAEPAPPLRPLSSSAADRCHSPFVEEDVAVFECMGKNNNAWVTAAIAVERAPPSPRSSASFTHEPPGGKTAPLFMHRFANGVPMLDSNASASCALVAGAASKSSWRNLGLKISPSRLQRRDGRLRFLLTEAPTPLKVKGGEEWSALSDIKAVHVAVSAHSEALLYTSLRKDAIAHKEGWVSVTESAVRQGLLALSSQESGGFHSAAEAARDMMQEDLLPLAASSVASMVSRSADVDFQKRCLQALGVGNEYVQEQRLCDLLQVELRRNVRQEEERRAKARARAAERRASEAKEAEEGKKKRKATKKKRAKTKGKSSAAAAATGGGGGRGDEA